MAWTMECGMLMCRSSSLFRDPDYENVIHDSCAMMAFSHIFQDLEAMFARELEVEPMIRVYGKILVNSFAVQDEYLRPIGRAVYLGSVCHLQQ